MWCLLGLALLGVEMLTPGGFFMLFFGLAALVVGAAVGVGVDEPTWLQWLAFSTLAITSVLFLRSRVLAWFHSRTGPSVGVENLMGETAILLDDLAPGGVGKAELRGTTWTVRSQESSLLPRGKRCRVQRVDGLTLWVIAE
jgi:membrane protein implicated in regulation of membrane protease activity